MTLEMSLLGSEGGENLTQRGRRSSDDGEKPAQRGTRGP